MLFVFLSAGRAALVQAQLRWLSTSHVYIDATQRLAIHCIASCANSTKACKSGAGRAALAQALAALAGHEARLCLRHVARLAGRLPALAGP